MPMMIRMARSNPNIKLICELAQKEESVVRISEVSYTPS